jgi:hypothetical protein
LDAGNRGGVARLSQPNADVGCGSGCFSHPTILAVRRSG